jgi:hypothetical protein
MVVLRYGAKLAAPPGWASIPGHGRIAAVAPANPEHAPVERRALWMFGGLLPVLVTAAYVPIIQAGALQALGGWALPLITGACQGTAGSWGKGAPDHAWLLAPPATGNYRVEVTAGFDVTVCAVAACTAIATTGLAGAGAGGVEEAESFVVHLAQGAQVFLIVDGQANDASAAGGYALAVTLQGAD